jgi:hypothetical protein
MPKISDLPSAASVSASDFIAIVDRTDVSVTKKATTAVFADSLLALTGFADNVLTQADGVKSDVMAVAGSAAVSNIIIVTQQQYDSIALPDSQTLYVIRAE